MKAFTYYDYIQCIHSIRLNKGQGLAEGQAEYQKSYIRSSRKDNLYEQLLAIQAQDALELSYNAHPLSDYACKKANSSIYRYDSNKNQYVMQKGIKASIDLPRRISMNAY